MISSEPGQKFLTRPWIIDNVNDADTCCCLGQHSPVGEFVKQDGAEADHVSIRLRSESTTIDLSQRHTEEWPVKARGQTFWALSVALLDVRPANFTSQ